MCAKRFGSKSVGTGQVLKDCKPERDSHNLLPWGRGFLWGPCSNPPWEGWFLSMAGFLSEALLTGGVGKAFVPGDCSVPPRRMFRDSLSGLQTEAPGGQIALY